MFRADYIADRKAAMDLAKAGKNQEAMETRGIAKWEKAALEKNVKELQSEAE